MERIETLGDERLSRACAYCGHVPARGDRTDDHVPSRVLLVEPHPESMPTVPACRACNGSFSHDEEYVGSLVECVLAGSADPAAVRNPKIRRTLEKQPKLAARLAAARRQAECGTVFVVETDRVERVLVKLARGHAHYEVAAPQYGPPSHVSFAPLPSVVDAVRVWLERVTDTGGHEPTVWPEVGSRAMQRILFGEPGWIEVQPGRYRFLAEDHDGVRVRIVIAEYLAAEIWWAA